MTQLRNEEHWATLHLSKRRKKVTISRIDMSLLVYTKYELGEITFLELKDRVKATNCLAEWVSGFSVLEDAYTRFRYGGLIPPKVSSHFLGLFQKKMFANIDQYGVDDFPRMTLENEEKTPAIEKDTL